MAKVLPELVQELAGCASHVKHQDLVTELPGPIAYSTLTMQVPIL